MNIQNSQSFANLKTGRAERSAPSLKIALRHMNDGSIVVKSCDLTCSQFDHRCSFHGATKQLDIFRTEIAKALQDFMQEASADTRILSFPDYMLELNGLTLVGAQIIFGKPKNGTQSATVIFKSAFGGLDAVLKDQFVHTVQTSRKKTFETDVMVDIAMPILDMISAIKFDTEQLSSAKVNEKLEYIIDNTHELQFRAELLKRFIHKSDPTRNLSLEGHV